MVETVMWKTVKEVTKMYFEPLMWVWTWLTRGKLYRPVGKW